MEKLIHKFVYDFEMLYGESSMLYNLHSHLHLPLQILRYGPLNKISAFGFEGFFKICRRYIHGTRAFQSQIANNLALNSVLFHEIALNVNEMSENNIKSFINNKLLCKNDKKSDSCLEPYLEKIDESNIVSFLRDNSFRLEDFIISKRAIVKNRSNIFF